MKLRINAESLPRYQSFGMVAIVMVLILSVTSFFLYRFQVDSEQRLQDLQTEVVKQQKAQLQSEVAATLDYINYMRSRAEEVLQQKAQEHVDHAVTIAQGIYRQNQGVRNDADIKRMIVESLRDVRFFNGRGYIFIDDMAGNCVLLPTAPQLEGTSLFENRDDTGRPIMQLLIDAVSNPAGNGFARYRWYAPGNDSQMRDKIAYARYFEPYDWLIGAGDYVFRIENDLKAEVLRRVGQLRFGENGYYAVLHKNGRVLSNPNAPASVGRHFSEIENPAEASLVERLIEKAGQGGGFVEYDWYRPDSGLSSHKMSLVQPVPGWDWILVAGIYPEDINRLLAQQTRELNQRLQDDNSMLVLALLVSAVITLSATLLFSRWLRTLFERYQHNIDQQQEALRANARDLEVAARVFETATEGIVVTSPDNRIVAVNTAFSDITGYSEAEALGRDPSFMSSGNHSAEFYDELWQTLAAEGRWQGEIVNRRKDGTLFPEWLSISACYDTQGRVVNYIATLADMTERRRAEERLQYLADYDPLTDLPNRHLLSQRVTQALASAQRYGGQLSLISIDLDRFKNINDSLGHGVGDQILQQIADRLRQAVRENDVVARLGGDEFAVLMADQDSPTAVANLVNQLIATIAEPLAGVGGELVITPSVGITIYPEDGSDFETLLRNADTALYHAKEQGRNNFQFFASEMNTRVSERLTLEAALRQALNRQEFELFYQPQYSCDDSQPQGCEALIRWRHPELGLVSPADFIPLAEEVGLILPIGYWVLDSACQQGADWLAAGYRPITIAVNVSASQFRTDLVGSVRRALDKTGFPAELLVLEVTESILMDDVQNTARTLAQVRQMGVKVALDDFGTGYSSLSYLKTFPLDKLKIDRSFIAGLPGDQEDGALTRSIIEIARHLKLKTIAEGIETPEQRDFLWQAGCDQLQGYLYARPVPAAEMGAQLEQANPVEPG
ncbi:bifunctional diguanylate cyclase/phosphodiesterase [Marinobacterium arenosum]|uniref:bifunctional diguanylate cyclase/phosphodiesterase n=1 Tax=Marinobacterium arenosum TaxID=2862496 RepID=UPI001C982839|nr:cache domain-containing protein [Marinobacterium arenosum]MBY4676647.1 cache domain-containing protein [Marinobacterium arenosum]